MNAVILAGGFGSRLKPLTDSVPKPMLPVANTPMLDYVISHLRAAGINRIVLTLGYLPETVTGWVSGYGGITADYIIEDIPLGTAGGVRRAREYLDDTFIVASGDALENINYAAMLRSHERSGKLVTIAVTSVPDPRQFGVVKYDESGTVTEFLEKPAEWHGEGTVNCGVYIINRSVLNLIPNGEKYDFSRDLFPGLVALGQINAYYHNGYWSDIGSPKAYYDANFKMINGGFYPFAVNKYRTVCRKSGHEMLNLAAYSSLVTGRCYGSIVGEGAAVASNANIKHCIVMPGVTVSGFHYGEIIGNEYCLPVAPEFYDYLHDSSDIYKNFS